MGGGASVEIHHNHTSFAHHNDSHFHDLLSSKLEREKLFGHIAEYKCEHHRIERKDKVSLLKLVGYFTNNTNALYPGFHVNVDILNGAFKYTIEKCKKSRKKNSMRNKGGTGTEDCLTKMMFHTFLPTLLLFIRVWDVFSAADKLVVEDQRVFKGEFMKIKEKLNNVHGICILGEVTDEEWEAEFLSLDRNKDKFITFDEMCIYAVSHIKKPFDYAPGEVTEYFSGVDEDEDESEENSSDAFVEIVAHPHAAAATASVTAAEAIEAVVPDAGAGTADITDVTATTDNLAMPAPTADGAADSEIQAPAAEEKKTDSEATPATEEGAPTAGETVAAATALAAQVESSSEPKVITEEVSGEVMFV
jgi:hypothetical protein